MPWSVAASVVGSYLTSQGTQSAADTQAAAAQQGIAQQQAMFNKIQENLKPYMTAGTGALSQMQNLMGLGGAKSQTAVINALQNSPQMKALIKQGENAILQNASATGGLRGGNVQGALAEFRPQILNSLISQQMQNLGSLTGLGQSSAAGVGNAGLSTAGNISNLLQQQGAATAGGQLAQSQVWGGALGSIGGLIQSGALKL